MGFKNPFTLLVITDNAGFMSAILLAVFFMFYAFFHFSMTVFSCVKYMYFCVQF